jgi:hypothetical protein
MSFQAMTWAIEQTPPDAESKLILLLLANYSGSEHTCWPSVSRLAKEALLSERTVQRRLQDLSEHSFIEITPRLDARGDPDSNLYRLICHQGVVSASRQWVSSSHHAGVIQSPGGGVSLTPKPVSTEPVIEPKRREVGFETMRQLLADAFYRPIDSPWSYSEEFTLLELVRQRPKLEPEFRMILDWRSKLEPAKRKFFPSSIESLLCNWSKTLDRARLSFKEPEPKPKSETVF